MPSLTKAQANIRLKDEESMANMNFTNEQQAFIDYAVASCDDPKLGNAILESGAGSGKTSVIKGIIRKLPPTWQKQTKILAFNKSIAEELKVRGYNAQTAHGFGYANMSRHLGNFCKLDTYKIETLVETKLGLDRFDKEGMAIVRCIGVAKNMGMQVPFSDNFLVEDTEEGWNKVADKAGALEYIKTYRDGCREILQISAKVPKLYHEIKEFKMTFDDMLYLPFLYDYQDAEQNRIIITDECQDLNPIQIEMQCFKAAFLHFFVGDPCQGIYEFRGADKNSYDSIKVRYNCKEFKLTQSFRCPQNICTFVSNHYGYSLKPHASIQHMGAVKNVYLDELDFKNEGVNAFLCMTNAPLMKLVPKLLDLGISIEVRSNLLGKLWYRFNTRTEAQLLDEIATGLQYQGHSTHYRDFIECLSFFYYSNRAFELLKQVTKSKDPNKIVLSTIHRAKGLEFDKVCFVQFLATPPLDQIRNLGWVGCTRAAHDLLIDITTGKR